jgi:spore maturation protein A
MMNTVWLALLLGATGSAVLNGALKETVAAATASAGQACALALGLVGVMSLWMGLMKIAEESGLAGRTAQLAAPLMARLFPRIPRDHPAMAGITMNIVANMFGLNNAATPLGIKAMKDLAELNPHKGEASDEMCMFLAINTSSVQVIPAGAIALLAAGGASDPTVIVLPAFLATCVSTAAAIFAARFFARMKGFRFPKQD